MPVCYNRMRKEIYHRDRDAMNSEITIMNLIQPLLLLVLLSLTGCIAHNEQIDKKFYEAKKAFVEHRLGYAEEIFIQLTKGQSKWAAPYAFLGRIYLARKEYAKAESELNRAYKLADTNVDILYHYARVLANRQAGQDEALGILEQLLSLDSNHIDGRMLRANIWEGKGRLDMAIVDWSYVISQRAQIADAYIRMGIIYLSNGRIDKAEEQFAEALRLKPGDGKLRSNIGLARHKYHSLNKSNKRQ